MPRRGRLPKEAEAKRNALVREHLGARRRPPTVGELARWASNRFDISADAARSLARRHMAEWQALPVADRLVLTRAHAALGVLVQEAAHG